jgi:glutamate-1-semialdehyde 2,1-aminomutase
VRGFFRGMEFEPTLIAAAAAALALAPRLVRRAQLSLAKHRSLAGHSKMALRVARWLPGMSFGEPEFFDPDGAPAEVLASRRAGFARLAATLNERHARTAALTRSTRGGLSDLQFTAAYRVPPPFSAWLRQQLTVGSFVQSSDGVHFTDLDGQRLVDLTGSYGVNLFGTDFYKSCIEEAVQRAGDVGLVLGHLHPAVADNVARLRAISGLDEVSFHMSGTEAVLQAVRLARYHTGRRKIVRFTGAYHGFWDDVQPGPGNPMPARDTYTLKERDAATLRVLRTRDDIACVLVNPLQALHPNRAAPGDSGLVDGTRSAGYDKAATTVWLKQLREVCTVRGIVLIFDEVFMGFRLAPGGAQQHFGVRADMVTYGKTLGGGLPVGVVCGRAALMKRWRDERPADICFARGTFNAHPYVMCAMQVFLERLATPAVQALYEGAEALWNARAAQMNNHLAAAGVPVRVAAMGTVWTVVYTQPGQHHWLLQFYLREAGLALSWVGSGRMIFHFGFDDAAFDDVVQRFTAAALRMRADGFFWHDGKTTAAQIRRRLLLRLLRGGNRTPAAAPDSAAAPALVSAAGHPGRSGVVRAHAPSGR